MANPANRGIAYNNNDFFVFRCNAYIIGTRIIKATSKKTGIAIKNPEITIAVGAFLSPNFEIMKLAIVFAPPENSKIAPNIAPNPTTVATKPKVPPIPSFMVSIISVAFNPAISPTVILPINNAINALILSFNIKKSNMAIPIITARIS